MESTLFHIPFSPWSLKARFALAHHGLQAVARVTRPCSTSSHARAAAQAARPDQRAGVVDAGGRLTDSWEIALYADRVGAGRPLIPGDSTAWPRGTRQRAPAERRSRPRHGPCRASPRQCASRCPRRCARCSRRHTGGQVGVQLFNRKYGITSGILALHESAMRLELDHLGRRWPDAPTCSATSPTRTSRWRSRCRSSTRCRARRWDPRAPPRPTTHSRRYAELLRWRDSVHAAHPLLPSKAAA